MMMGSTFLVAVAEAPPYPPTSSICNGSSLWVANLKPPTPSPMAIKGEGEEHFKNNITRQGSEEENSPREE